MNENPLVSVPVITYNSSQYIIEGLESIKNQTYQNIELIISDDCSTDDTVDVCREWLNKNKSRFVRTLLVTTDKNTGVAGNCNRAIKPCSGKWVKMLSGDDKFLPYTIEEYVGYVNNHPEASICFAKLLFYGEDANSVTTARHYYEKKLYPLIKASQKVQFRENLKQMFIPGPGLFYKKSLYDKIDGFDERYQFCEEDPFTYKVLKAGERVYFIDRELYKYQVRAESLCRDESKTISRHMADRIKYFSDYGFSHLISNGNISRALQRAVDYKVMRCESEGSPRYKILLIKLFKVLLPSYYVDRIKNLYN